MSSTVKAVKKLLLVATIAIALGFASTIAYANCLYYVGDTGDGRTVWLSCGSSSGSYIYTCENGLCQNEPDLDGAAQQLCIDMPPCN